MIDAKRFYTAREQVLSESYEEKGIGTLAEKTIHRILKLYIEPNVKNHEVKYRGIVADIFNSEGIFEIQTASFERLSKKLTRILDDVRVTIVCPIISEKTLCWINKGTGEISEPRKSPKKETALDVFRNLYRIKDFLDNDNLHILLVDLNVQEYKYLNGRDKTGKKGSTRAERIPNKLLDIREISSVDDYARFFPKNLSEKFTASEFSRAIKRTQRYAYTILRFFLHVGVISHAGNKGKAFLYELNNRK